MSTLYMFEPALIVFEISTFQIDDLENVGYENTRF